MPWESVSLGAEGNLIPGTVALYKRTKAGNRVCIDWMDPDEARELAMQLLSGAEAAQPVHDYHRRQKAGGDAPDAAQAWEGSG